MGRLALLLLLAAAAGAAGETELRWRGVAEGFAEARRTHQPVFLHVYADG